jgi:hypothetical protein
MTTFSIMSSSDGSWESRDRTALHETIRHCSFDYWYGKIRPRTVHSVVIDIPADFCHFLLEEDFFVVPERFPEFKDAFEMALEELGGRAFVKLNFTAPTDAAWMCSGRCLDVTKFVDCIRLLKASTRILIDLLKPFGETIVPPIKPVLVLRRWFCYRRNREFRVFAKSENLFFITSRYCDVPCDLADEQISDLIARFLHETVQKVFTEERLIFDVYISPKLNLHLVDVAPWNSTADTGLFNGEEIEELTECVTRICRSLNVLPSDPDEAPIELQDGKSLEELLRSLKEFNDDDQV